MNKYSICLRTDDSHYLEADRFEFKYGCLVFERTRDPFPLVAVFGASEIVSVRLLDDPIRSSDRPEPLDTGKFDGHTMKAVLSTSKAVSKAA